MKTARVLRLFSPALLPPKLQASPLTPKSLISSFAPNPPPDRTRLLALLRCTCSIEFLTELHALLLVTGLAKDHSFILETIHQYLSLGHPNLALSAFISAPSPTLYLQNVAIRSFSDHGFYDDLLRLYGRSQSSFRCGSDNFTFPLVIKACTAVPCLRAGEEVHCMVLRSGYGSNVGVGTALLDMYAKMGRMGASRWVFDDMPARDSVSWNAMISGYSLNGCAQEAFAAVQKMQLDGFRLNSSTLNTIIPTCTSLGAADAGGSLHAIALKNGAFGDEALAPTLISMYAGLEDLSSARLMFEQQPWKDLVAWNAMISALTQHGKFEEAFEVFKGMRQEFVSPNLVTLASVLPSCSNLSGIHHGESIHAIIIKIGLVDHLSISSALVTMYAKHGKVASAKHLYLGTSEKNLLLMNSMMSGYLVNCKSNMVLETFRDMMLEGIAPDAVSMVNVISGCKDAKDLLSGKSAHAYSIRVGLNSMSNVTNTLLALYSECAHLATSLRLFRRMQAQDVVSWNTIISGFAEIEDAEASMGLFREMHREGVQFDVITAISLLSSFSQAEDLINGVAVHSLAIRSGCHADTSLTNALITMYTGCGDVESGHTLFEHLPFKNLVSWNALMTGYRKNNMNDKVMKLYYQMVDGAQKPNSVTLLNILPICKSHLHGGSMHGFSVRNFWALELPFLTATINMYARFEKINCCHLVFEMIDRRNAVGWNSMIFACVESKQAEEGIIYFRKMIQMEVEPDNITMLAVGSACSQLRSIDLAQCLTGFALSRGFNSHTSVVNSLIDMNARCGNIPLAKELFDGLREKDSITWSTMINAYGMHGNGVASLDLFTVMKEAGIPPDDVTFVSVLSACSHAGMVEQGRNLFRSMVQHDRILPRLEHYACMVDLFGRTGHLDEAYDLVKNLPFDPPTSLLESLLGACRGHGDSKTGEAVGKLLVESKQCNPSSYVMLSNIYALTGRWTDYARLRCDMKDKGLKKDVGVSLIEAT